MKEGSINVVHDLLNALNEEDLKDRLSTKNSHGITVLHEAVTARDDELGEILQMLLDKGGGTCLYIKTFLH